MWVVMLNLVGGPSLRVMVLTSNLCCLFGQLQAPRKAFFPGACALAAPSYNSIMIVIVVSVWVVVFMLFEAHTPR